MVQHTALLESTYRGYCSLLLLRQFVRDTGDTVRASTGTCAQGAGEADTAAQLRRRLGSLFEAMPRDLQQTMLSAPRRASMLQNLRVQSKVAIPGMPVPVCTSLSLPDSLLRPRACDALAYFARMQ